jgi:ABC-type uncharacterized transport system permease subunit
MSDSQLKSNIADILRPVFAALIGLVVGVGLTWFSGENPLYVAAVLFEGALGNSYNIGMTLFYTTPLIFTGLAVALPFHAGLFNIGAEGQLLIGTLAAAICGILMPPESGVLAIMLGTVLAFLAAAVYGSIAGWIRARRGGHEVISTIMLNFIAAGLTSWAVLYHFKSLDSQNPESARIAESMLMLPFSYFEGAPVSVAFPVAILVAVLMWFILNKTVFGFEIVATGQNPDAARVNGIDIARVRILVLALAGGLAGLVALAEVFGNAGRFKIGFSADYGFVGIPVALLARCHPVGVIFSAFLFGALHKGSSELDLETTFVTRDVSYLIQAMVILAVSADGIYWLRKRLKLGQKKGAPVV